MPRNSRKRLRDHGRKKLAARAGRQEREKERDALTRPMPVTVDDRDAIVALGGTPVGTPTVTEKNRAKKRGGSCGIRRSAIWRLAIETSGEPKPDPAKQIVRGIAAIKSRATYEIDQRRRLRRSSIYFGSVLRLDRDSIPSVAPSPEDLLIAKEEELELYGDEESFYRSNEPGERANLAAFAWERSQPKPQSPFADCVSREDDVERWQERRIKEELDDSQDR